MNCKICNKSFNSWRQLNGHVTCAHNKNHQDKVASYKKLRKEIIKKKCEKCDKDFSLTRTISKNGRQKISKKERKFCSRNCANSHVQTKELNYNRSIANRNKTLWNKDFSLIYFSFCKSCGKSLCAKNKSGYCTVCCKRTKEYKEKTSKIWKEKSSSLEARNRLRDIGRNGGFGKKDIPKKTTDMNLFLKNNVLNF